MSLYVETKTTNGQMVRAEWHVGSPIPEMGRIVKFQADGDELDLIIDAMLGTSAKANL